MEIRYMSDPEWLKFPEKQQEEPEPGPELEPEPTLDQVLSAKQGQLACIITKFTDLVPSVGRNRTWENPSPEDVSYVFSSVADEPAVVLDRISNDLSLHINVDCHDMQTRAALIGLARMNEIPFTEFSNDGQEESEVDEVLDRGSGRGAVLAQADPATGKVKLNIADPTGEIQKAAQHLHELVEKAKRGNRADTTGSPASETKH
jgi:hypothetical protein